MRILWIYMTTEKNTQKYPEIITLRVNEEFKEILDSLQKQTLLNRASVIRYAVMELYRNKKGE